MANISKIKLPSGTTYDIVDNGARQLIENLPKSMVFKGTLGTGGTITTLPKAAAENVGWTYKVITEGIYVEQAAKVGDLFVGTDLGEAENPRYVWTLVPSGDEPSGTVTNVATGVGLTGGPITSSGEISLDMTGASAGKVLSATSASTVGWSTVVMNNTAACQLTVVSGTASYQLNHGLGTRMVAVQVYDATTYETIIADVVRDGDNTVTVSFDSTSIPLHNCVVLCTAMSTSSVPSGEEVSY